MDGVIGQLNGQFTRYVSVSGQNMSCARTIVSHFAELTDFFFDFFHWELALYKYCIYIYIMKTYNQCLVSFSNFVKVLINW